MTKSLAAAPPLTDVSKVLFKVTPQDLSGGSTSYVATRQAGTDSGIAVWHVHEQILTLDGRYVVTAIIQRTQSPDLKAAFRLDLSETTGLTATAAQVVDDRLGDLRIWMEHRPAFFRELARVAPHFFQAFRCWLLHPLSPLTSRPQRAR